MLKAGNGVVIPKRVSSQLCVTFSFQSKPINTFKNPAYTTSGFLHFRAFDHGYYHKTKLNR